MKQLIGSKDFYKKVLLLAIPIIVQSGITNFVSLLDNLMIGQVGTDEMSGVAIVNQLIMVFNISIFGAVSGPGIFGAQFFGAGNYKGQRDAFRFKVLICVVVAVVTMFIFGKFGTELISLYLHEGGVEGSIELTLLHGKKYIDIMLISMIPFALSNAYAFTLRESSQTVVPMIASVIAVLTNTVLNYMLIFGKFGLPVLGVEGAAIATVAARFIECAILIVWTHKNNKKNVFIQGAYKSIRIPKQLLKGIIIKGLPLMVNEFLWASGTATMMKCYSERGLEVVAAMNICVTISNVFNIVFLAMGNVVAIIVGQQLGAGKMKEAKGTAYKMIFLSVVICIISGTFMALTSGIFPMVYNISDTIKELATKLILVAALCMPLYAFEHAAYFTIRSGGKTIITFLFDSAFIWVVSIPFASFITGNTNLNIVYVYLFCQLLEIIKCVVGYVMVKKGVWLNNIV